ncbi:probable N-acetylglucosaminyl-phosphatidylinositol de-N-acetylase [Bolinopsis microptera]|uniref:probable N-acetylglucosaminyl-phosphatidylinositol de-N-acetylase n=1 Tax=Bolinopsis microptera TaxID=2820187 RepID=UPI003079FF0B
MYPIIVSLCTTITAYIFIGFYFLGTARWPSSYHNKRVLFVTSHPDDECMFFGPTIRYFQSVGQVFLLCLSNGNHDGLGEVREEELEQSAKKLGIPGENMKIAENEGLQDGPSNKWDVEVVGEEVGNYAKQCTPDIIITFDRYGVSGHPNHIATSKGVTYACKNSSVSSDTLIYQLDSVNVIRKYSSFMDCFISCTSKIYMIASLRDIINIQGAMKHHGSQLTWFRKLYVVFSRYMVVNSLRSVSVQ